MRPSSRGSVLGTVSICSRSSRMISARKKHVCGRRKTGQCRSDGREGTTIPLLEYDIEKGRRTLDFRRLGVANLAPSRFTGGVTASPYRNLLDDRVTPAKLAINPFYKLMRSNQKTEAMVVARNWKLQRQTFKQDTATSMFIQRTFKVTKAQANVTVPHIKKTEKYQDKTAKWQKEVLDATKDNKTDTSQWQKETTTWQKDTLKVLNEAKDAIKEFREKGTGDKADKKAEAKSIIKEAEGAIVKGALAGAAGAAAAGALKTIFPTFTKMFTAPFKSMGGLAKRLPGAAMATRAGGAVSRLGGRVAGGIATRAPGLATLGKAALGGTKMLGKGLSYMVPGLGLMVGLGGAAHAYKKGDILGALTNTAGGLASLLPGLGPLVGIAITAIGDMIPQGIRDAFNKVAGPILSDMMSKLMGSIRTFFIEKLGMSGPGFDALLAGIRELTIGTFEAIYDTFQNIIRIFKSPLFTKVIYPLLVGTITALATLVTTFFRELAQIGKMISGFWADLLEGKGLWNAFKTNIIDPVFSLFKTIGNFFSSETMYKFVREALPPKMRWAADAAFFGTVQAQKEEKATSSQAFQEMAAQAREGKLSDAKTAMDLLDREYNRVIGGLDPKTQAAQIQTLLKDQQEARKSWKEAPSRVDVKGALVRAEETFSKLRKPEEKPATAPAPAAPAKPTTKTPEAAKPAVVVAPVPTGTKLTPEQEREFVEWHTRETDRVTARSPDWRKKISNVPTPRPKFLPPVGAAAVPAAVPVVTATEKMTEATEAATTTQQESTTATTALAENTVEASKVQEQSTSIYEKVTTSLTKAMEKLQKTIEKMIAGEATMVEGSDTAPGVVTGKGGWSPRRSATLQANITQAAQKYGVDPGYMTAMAYIESKGDPGAVNPKSGATGVYQFMAGTGRDYGLVGPQGDIRKNEKANVDAAARLARDNAAQLRKHGIQPTPDMLYLAHQQGWYGAVKIAQAAKSGGSVSPTIQRNMRANVPGGQNLTPRAFLEYWQRTYYAQAANAGVQYDKQGGPVAVAAGPATTAATTAKTGAGKVTKGAKAAAAAGTAAAAAAGTAAAGTAAAGATAAGAAATTAATVATKAADVVKDTASQALDAAKNLDVKELASKLPDLSSVAPDLSGLTQLFSGLGADLGSMLGPLATQGGDLLGMLMGGELTAALGSFPGLTPEMLGDLKGQLMTAVTGVQGALQAEMTRMVQGLGEALGGKPVDPVQHQMLETLQRSTEYQREMMNRDSANAALQAMQTVKDPMLELLAGLGQ